LQQGRFAGHQADPSGLRCRVRHGLLDRRGGGSAAGTESDACHAIVVQAEEFRSSPDPAKGAPDPGLRVERVQVVDQEQALHEWVGDEPGPQQWIVATTAELTD